LVGPRVLLRLSLERRLESSELEWGRLEVGRLWPGLSLGKNKRVGGHLVNITAGIFGLVSGGGNG